MRRIGQSLQLLIRYAKYLPDLRSLIQEAINARKDGDLSNYEKGEISKKFWKLVDHIVEASNAKPR